MKKSHSFLLFLIIPTILVSQWSNRYPKVKGYGHHVYLEAFELPILNVGPTDPAPGPAAVPHKLAFAARGWLWVMDLNTGKASRVTASEAVDASPAWSPMGQQLVFVRDTGTDTGIYLIDLNTNTERLLVNSPALELDPIFSSDGSHVYYASGERGSLDLWKINLATGIRTALTHHIGSGNQIERMPVPVAGDQHLLYLRKKEFSFDAIELLSLSDSTITVLAEESFASQLAFSLGPDQHTLAYTWPQDDDYELRLLDTHRPESNLLLTRSKGLPLQPAFSAGGDWVYFMELDPGEISQIKRVSVNGGPVETLEIAEWDWGHATTSLSIRSNVNGQQAPVRMSVTTAGGHPLLPGTGAVYSDGQSGRTFFYSPGEITLQVPAGDLRIEAVQGLATPLAVKTVSATESKQETAIALKTVYDARRNGWYSGDNHFHLNYGGAYQLDPADLETNMAGEGLDMGWPLLANIHNRFLEQDLWGWENQGPQKIRFGQEVRSHFLGHLNLIGTKELFWPWVWGPSYEVYGKDDRLNAEPLRFAREQDALAGYVHPIGSREPFAQTDPPPSMPVAMVADAVLGEADLLEVACLWTDEIGTASFWHHILNLGIPMVASAGSDVMTDYYRTMAAGSTRNYVQTEGPFTEASYLQALNDGRSFVTNGPLLEFQLGDTGIGGILPAGTRRSRFNLKVHSAVPYETVEIFVNGTMAARFTGSSAPGSKEYEGRLVLPANGWVTARVSGGTSAWPMMDSYPFAETGPIWLGSRNSTDHAAKKAAAINLLRALEAATARLERGYGDTPIPNLKAHFQKAREKLEGIIDSGQ